MMTFIMLPRAIPSASIEILRPWFLEMTRRGLSTFIRRNIFTAFRFPEFVMYDEIYKDISRLVLTETMMIRKSSWFHRFLR